MAFGKRIDKPGGSRRSPRENLISRTVLMAMTESHTVDLLDLSTSGARLAGCDLPSPGQDVLMLIGRLEAFGTVVWREEDQCGIEFDIGLSETALSTLQNECRQTARIGGAAAEDWLFGSAR
jgi:hypothetical protein